MKLIYQSGQKPLWSQLYDILEERILNEEYKEGEVLPSEMAIMEEFEVSRITVRQAMNKLISAGLITRRRGKGTMVLKRENHIATSFQSIFNGVEEKNNINDRRIIGLEYAIPPIEVAYFFDITANMPIIKLTRQTFIEEKPVIHYETYINPIVPVDTDTIFDPSMYKVLEKEGFPINQVKEKITASIITAKQKELFKINKNIAIINRIRLGMSNERPIEYTFSEYVADGYELIIDSK